MTSKRAKEVLDKIVGQVFGYQNPYTLEQFMQKYAFDVRLPAQVNDSTTGEETWTQSVNPTKFMTFNNVKKRSSIDDWTVPTQPLQNIQDILDAWSQVNLTATEREIESINVGESDNIYSSENIYRSLDVIRSKNVLFSDGAWDCEFVAANQRSNTSNFCIRLEDSKESSNSFSVSWSGKIVNSLFIHDSFDLYECMFCSHVASKRYCIANMQFSEEEYMKLKDEVVGWVLTAT